MADINSPSEEKKSIGWLREIKEIISELVDKVNGYVNTKMTTPLVEADTITEKTANNGVTIEGVSIKDGRVNPLGLGQAANTGQILSGTKTVAKAQIIGTDAGDIGHALGAELLADDQVGEDEVVELVSCMAFYERNTDTYTGGADDLAIVDGDGAAMTNPVDKLKLLAAATNKHYKFTGTDCVPAIGKGIRVAGTAYTDPGTAAGEVRFHFTYRLHKTGF